MTEIERYLEKLSHEGGNMSRRNINGMSGFQANRIKSKMMRSHHCSTTAQKHAYPLFASENMGVLTPDGCAEMF